MSGDKYFNRDFGNTGEDLASRHLTRNGFRILVRNYRCRSGEIDIIAEKNGVIHFVEVKNRSSDLVPGRFAVNANKQKHIKSAAQHYLTTRGKLYDSLVSFDVFEITDDVTEFLENCFY